MRPQSSFIPFQSSHTLQNSLFKNTSIHSTHFLSLYYHFSPLQAYISLQLSSFLPSLCTPCIHPSSTPLLCPSSLRLFSLSLSSPLAVPPWQRAWVWACFLSRQPTVACPHCEQGKYAPLCLCGTHPSMWKWSECRLVNQSIEQTCLKPRPWNPSLLLFYAWQMS